MSCTFASALDRHARPAYPQGRAVAQAPSCTVLRPHRGALAQLGEHSLCKRRVAGSNPAGSTKEKAVAQAKGRAANRRARPPSYPTAAFRLLYIHPLAHTRPAAAHDRQRSSSFAGQPTSRLRRHGPPQGRGLRPAPVRRRRARAARGKPTPTRAHSRPLPRHRPSILRQRSTRRTPRQPLSSPPTATPSAPPTPRSTSSPAGRSSTPREEDPAPHLLTTYWTLSEATGKSERTLMRHLVEDGHPWSPTVRHLVDVRHNYGELKSGDVSRPCIVGTVIRFFPRGRQSPNARVKRWGERDLIEEADAGRTSACRPSRDRYGRRSPRMSAYRPVREEARNHNWVMLHVGRSLEPVREDLATLYADIPDAHVLNALRADLSIAVGRAETRGQSVRRARKRWVNLAATILARRFRDDRPRDHVPLPEPRDGIAGYRFRNGRARAGAGRWLHQPVAPGAVGGVARGGRDGLEPTPGRCCLASRAWQSRRGRWASASRWRGRGPWSSRRASTRSSGTTASGAGHA